MKTTEQSKTRARQRKLEVAETTPKEEAAVLVSEVFKLNKLMNATKAAHDKVRKALYGKMKELGLTTLETAGQSESGGTFIIEAVISTPSGQAVDPKKLATLVPMETFLDMVDVSQKAVTEKVGTAILNQVLVSTTGTENVKVGLKG